ncbi:MAG TPA: cupin domain-containing protein [Thermodesulfobacteriota bacterium]|nr:cupin domain-containing protein [Thermodesulfobacteriota bacterium]
MSRPRPVFEDYTDWMPPKPQLLEPVIIRRSELEAEIQRLADRPASRRRRVEITHSDLVGDGGLAPGTTVSLCVLKPGESTAPHRHNSSVVNFCIRGRGYSIIGGKKIEFGPLDVWTTPAWAVHQHVNDGDELQVRLSYSNAALLRRLKVLIWDEEPGENPTLKAEEVEKLEESERGMLLTEDGARLLTYEQLISPEVRYPKPLHWPWPKVKAELDKLKSLGPEYTGRRLYLLYHPATGRTQGTSFNFFATMCVRPAGIVDIPHRHTSSAINYFFAGRGYSVIEGHRYDWEAGDLMLTAPGWAIHNHASKDEDVYELTIQDSPLQIAMGSLLWQENMKQPMEALGLTGGFKTTMDRKVGSVSTRTAQG